MKNSLLYIVMAILFVLGLTAKPTYAQENEQRFKLTGEIETTFRPLSASMSCVAAHAPMAPGKPNPIDPR